MRWMLAAITIAMFGVGFGGCAPSSHSYESSDHFTSEAAPGGSGNIAASSTYLAAAVRDLAGGAIRLMTLAEPGMCPGHFDLRPSQVRQTQECRMLVRFDFQQSLDARLRRADGRQPRVVAVRIDGGMCEPDSYLSACRQLAEALVDDGDLAPETCDHRLAEIAVRMKDLHGWARSRVEEAGLAGVPILASRHQEAFCRGLGLRVVATFPAVDISLPGEIDQAVQQGKTADIKLVVANLPEGRMAADALADRFDANVVVFDNFPTSDEPGAFDEMVRRNVDHLVKLSQP